MGRRADPQAQTRPGPLHKCGVKYVLFREPRYGPRTTALGRKPNDRSGWIFAVPLSDATMEKADARGLFEYGWKPLAQFEAKAAVEMLRS